MKEGRRERGKGECDKQMGSEEDMVWETEGVRGSEWEGYLHSRTGWWDWGGWAQRVKWRVFGP